MQAYLISLFDDESSVLTLILQKAGFAVHSTRAISQLTTSWPEQPLDFILIALAEDTAEILNEINQLRLQTAVPLMLITDSCDETHQVALLDAGIDCLICRPFGVRYLLAQIHALLRRSEGTSLFNLPTLIQGEVSLDPSTRTVTVGEKEPIHLTQLEFRLLHTLITNPGQVIPTENLVEYVWGYSGEGNRDLVRGLVQRLRTKLEPDPRKPSYIINIPSVGYSFQKES